MNRTERIARMLHPERWQRHDQGASGYVHDREIEDSLELAARVMPLVQQYRDVLITFRSYGCPQCRGDCGSANPPVTNCPMQQIDRLLNQ